MNNKVRTCPYCGSQKMMLARKVQRLGKFLHITHYYVQCMICGYYVMGETEDDAINKWNEEDD